VEITGGLRSNGWAGAEIWPRGAEKGLTLAEVIRRSEVLTAGTDGGGLDDLLGIAVIGREKGTGVWLCWTHAFISPEGWERRKANRTVYEEFIRDGDLTLVERLAGRRDCGRRHYPAMHGFREAGEGRRRPCRPWFDRR
jgi:phage terminase large subunit-like protein